MSRAEIYDAISDERERQERMRIEKGWAWSMGTPGVPHIQKLMPLMEEAGEVARAVRVETGFATDRPGHALRAELIQLAACAVGFLEALEEEARRVSD